MEVRFDFLLKWQELRMDENADPPHIYNDVTCVMRLKVLYHVFNICGGVSYAS